MLPFSSVFTGLLFFSAALQAAPINWSISLVASTLSGAAGTDLIFDGIITNNTGTDLLLDSSAVQFTTTAPSSSYITGYAPDFLDTLGDIPTNGYSGALFTTTWLASAPSGATGTGFFDLTAEAPANPSALSVAFSASLSGTTTATPEPGGVTVLALAMLLIVARSHRGSRYR
jgi:hypothetical protein